MNSQEQVPAAGRRGCGILSVLMSILAAGGLVAQDVPIFHVYVDPIFGDNAQAFANNPGPNWPVTPPAPFSSHPDAIQFASDVPQGIVRHAPYSFRTLTGPPGAPCVRSYLEQFSSGVVPWVIIHCLPGLYGPTLSAPIDQRSGLVYNGETWPFLLRWNWSLQGTSALDTIFDGRNQPTAVIVVQADWFQQLSHRESIIDSLTIRGARVNGQPMSAANASGAGIYISGTPINSTNRGVQIGVTISNCFIVDNHVGVGIDNTLPFELVWISDPRIVNNTFARNWIGLWSGDRDAGEEDNTGWARPVLLNNIFDSWRPDVPATGTTPFVGIHPYEIAVGAVEMNGVPNWVNLDPIRSYCAWEAGRENFPVALPGWPVPNVQAPFPPFPVPRVDLQHFVGTNPTRARGTLYVNDAFRNAGIQAVPGVDYTPHDYRLSPSTGKEPLAPLAYLNPLVNMGIRLGYTNTLGERITAIRMARRRFNIPPQGPPDDIGIPPGPPDREPDATLHAWDWDCEGFGNPRGLNRSYFQVGTDRFDTDMDIGADEMDELIIAGYIDSTRVLGTGTTVLIGDHQRLYFVNVADTTAAFARPWFNSIDGKTYKWWEHVQGAPDGALGTNYTAGVPNSRRANLRTLFGKPLFMRSLECDISPHLMADPHPLWWFGFQPQAGEAPEIYASNPWWWHDAITPLDVFNHDNGALYDNVNGTWNVHGSANVIRQPFGMFRTTVLSGTINPPGTGVTQLSNGVLYLHPVYPAGVFLSVLPCRGGGVAYYSVDVWGLGDAGVNCPDRVPTLLDERGLRGNFQVSDGTGWHNLQTLLSAKGPPIPVEESMLRAPAPETMLRHSTMVEEMLRRRRR